MATNFSALLKRLLPIKRGMLLTDIITTERINAIQELLIGLASGDNIFNGLNIMKAHGSGWVKLSAPNAQPSSRNAASREKCYLEVSDASNDGSKRLHVSWGRMNGGVPDRIDFTPRGKFYSPGLEEGFVYAKVTFSFGGAGVVSGRTIVFLTSAPDNTSSSGFELMAQFKTEGARYSVSSACGHIDISPCDLADP